MLLTNNITQLGDSLEEMETYLESLWRVLKVVTVLDRSNRGIRPGYRAVYSLAGLLLVEV